MMKRFSIVFLQTFLLLLAGVTLLFLIRLPLMEGRAKNLSLFKIYADPFVLYFWVASIPFFIALMKAFQWLRYIGNGQAFSLNSLHALIAISRCAKTLAILIGSAGLYIKIFHDADDDPVGFLVLCIAAVILALAVVAATTLCIDTLRKNLKNQAEAKAKSERSVSL